MNAQKTTFRGQPITTTGTVCIGVLAGLFALGGESAGASVIVADGLSVVANTSQTQTQQELDLYACATWATDQTGFDPITHASGISPADSVARNLDYRRAMAACLQGRGYTVSIVEPTPAAASSASRPVAAMAPADSPAPPGKWTFLGSYESPMGSGNDNAVIDLTSSYNYDYVVYSVWVGSGLVHLNGNWAPSSRQWAFSNLDVDCRHHTFREHRFINQAGSIPRSADKWIAIEDAWQPIQLAEKQVCEQFQ